MSSPRKPRPRRRGLSSSSVDQFGGNEGKDQNRRGEHTTSDQQQPGVQGAGVGFEDANEGGREEAAKVAGAVDEGDARSRGRSAEEGGGQGPEHGNRGDDANNGQVHADGGEQRAVAALGAEDEAHRGDQAGGDDVPAAL